MSERPIIVVGAPGEEARAAAAQAGARAVSARYLAGIDCLVIDLSTGARLSVPVGVLEVFADVPPRALGDVAVGADGREFGLPGLRVPVDDLLAGRLGSPEWMAGHAVRARRLRADQLRRLTRGALAEPTPTVP